MTTAISTSKRCKTSKNSDEMQQQLLPGLPDHLGQLCLSHLKNSSFLLYSVCKSWRNLIYSESFPPFLSLYALLSSTNNNTTTNTATPSSPIQFSSFDPISSTWIPLPLPPPPDPDSSLQPLVLQHPSFLARNLPIQSVAVAGHLVLLAATTHNLLPALACPLIFNPISNKWCLGPPFSNPRRWCAAGSVHRSLYVASGIGSGYTQEIARSAERLDLKKSKARSEELEWEKVTPLKHGKFSREAVEAVGWRGKLYMVNVKGHAPKEGVVYNVENNLWEKMPEGMLFGWNGPATSMNEDVIYVVDEEKCVLKIYNPKTDCWDNVMESLKLKGAMQITAGGGKVCIVCTGGSDVVVVDVVHRPTSFWVVRPPMEKKFVAAHILPRLIPQETGHRNG
ncbi:hypothetical protein GIB67_011679 [Kingdonia uniflora]|uniref:F-box/kelch-repeat protein SKIP25 n=1 Tax=Kingdonia uniflora TaxID=39325 RepID=A0A7J7LUF8_9MAGN|nr:hypothetical protein GIB67_011679 [Kingdonia uniflora]